MDILQIGECYTGSQPSTLQELESRLNGQRLTIKVCEDSQSARLASVEKILLDSKQPYIMSYVGQSDMVSL